mgnify:CR=1 FL=1|tara:strand:- start:4125 stop:4814 length:690 start_codon:yes stop_codon:yes gene_type:complete
MPTLTLNKGGSIVGTADTTQAAARDEVNGTSIIQDASSNNAIQYFKSSGRGGGTFRYTRSFLQFDASAITGTVTAATLNVESHGANNSGDVIVVASDAFGGASSDLVNSDFDNVDFSTTYSSELTTWNNNGSNNAITLNAAARSAISSNNSFICAIINHDSDFQDTDSLSGDGSETNGVDFAGTITLVVTVAAAAGPTNLTSLNGIAKTSITSFNTIALASIDEINTVS